MKIIIAPQAFKGSYTAFEIEKVIEQSMRGVFPDAVFQFLPVSDGGDGFLDIMLHIKSCKATTFIATGPLGDSVEAKWGIFNDPPVAVIELAKIAGVSMIPYEKRNPMIATTFGVGEVIREALDGGIRHFLIGIGGSATNDAGAGLASALGVRFLDDRGAILPPGGAALHRLDRIDLADIDPRIFESKLIIGCDVNNVFTGSKGASLVYSMQKGASEKDALQLDIALSHFNEVVKSQLGIDLNTVSGSGAAGGTGGGMYALLGASLHSGIELVLDEMDFDHHLDGAFLVVTGEGCMDAQTVYGKGPVQIAKRAKLKGIPVYAFVGSIGEGYEAVYDYGIGKIILM